MYNLEKNAVKAVAKVSPWLAPFPSAYFVARSAILHLGLPLPVSIVVATIIETLGLATVHSALWAYDWNAHKRKTDPSAPVALAVVLGAVYVLATLGLVVFLEIWPVLAIYAPAIFPALAVVGALNLAMISRQEQREEAVKEEKSARRAARQASRGSVRPPADREVLSQLSNNRGLDGRIDMLQAGRRAKRAARMDALLAFYRDHPDAGPTEAARAVGVSRQTVYTYLAELETAGRIARNGNGIEVLEGG
jgi:hypothetical protein